MDNNLAERRRISYQRFIQPLPMPRDTGTYQCSLMRNRRQALNLGWLPEEAQYFYPNTWRNRLRFMLRKLFCK